jgi:hypothetical protein
VRRQSACTDVTSGIMSYPKTVAVAIGVVLGLWMVWNVALLLYRIYREPATGFGFVLGGLLEGILTAMILGWLAGTAWYFVRRH